MSAPSVLLFGLSHVIAVQVAQAHRAQRKTERFKLVSYQLFPKYNPLYEEVDGRVRLHEAIEPDLREVVESTQPQLILGSFWSNQHFVLATWNLTRRIDLVLPSAPDLPLDPAAEVLPYDLVYRHMLKFCEPIRLMIETTQRVSRAPLRLLKAPPPVFDFAAIPAGSSSKEVDALVAKHGLAPPHLRYKFWRIVDAIHQDYADAAGVTALPVPPEAAQPDGFRRREYYGTDWIHANVAYGELALKQCEAELGLGES